MTQEHRGFEGEYMDRRLRKDAADHRCMHFVRRTRASSKGIRCGERALYVRFHGGPADTEIVRSFYCARHARISGLDVDALQASEPAGGAS